MEQKTIDKKIDFLTKSFKDNNYILSEIDIKDLKTQLYRKPVQLYFKTIDAIKLNDKKRLTYENVAGMIKADIKIRNKIRDLITSLEEAIRVKYIDKNLELYEIDKFFEIAQSPNSKYYFSNIIDDLKIKDVNEKDLYDKISKIRNKVSHLVYPMIFNYFGTLLIRLEEIKELDFVNNTIVDSYIKNINKISEE
jgi:site-specific DNA-cytosine methylase